CAATTNTHANVPAMMVIIASKPERNPPTAAVTTKERLDAQVSVSFQDALNQNRLLAFTPQPCVMRDAVVDRAALARGLRSEWPENTDKNCRGQSKGVARGAFVRRSGLTKRVVQPPALKATASHHEARLIADQSSPAEIS